MREIKFRVWTGKEMHCITHEAGLQLNFGINDGWSLWEEYGEICTHKDGELMQYTGLKDKNAVEIYAGDILSWHNHNNVQFIGVVTEKPGVIYIDWKAPTEYPSFIYEAGVGKMEVIGSIYTHPRPLGSEKE